SNPSVAAVIAVRGGYGSVHMLPLLDAAVIRRTPKLFIGYSDNTSLLSWLTCQCGIAALHGPMIEGRLAKGAEAYDRDSMLAFMQDGSGRLLAPDGLAVIRGGEAAGPLFGGTLRTGCDSRLRAGLSRSCHHGIPVRPHDGPMLDAAARRSSACRHHAAAIDRRRGVSR